MLPVLTLIYANTRELEKIDGQDINVIVPSQKQASHEKPKPFDKSNFQYDSENDQYRCPEDHVLNYSYTNNYEGHSIYMMREKGICQRCPHFGVCTRSKQGRTIARLINEEVKQKLEAQYEESESQAIYELRQQKAELPFGHIKRNLKVDAFLLRGLDGARAEASLLASCFNIRRMISLIGARALIKKLKNLASSTGTSLLDRQDIASPLAGLRDSVCPKEEVRENKENNASAFVQNSNRRAKIWIDRVFLSRRMVEFPSLCQRALV